MSTLYYFGYGSNLFVPRMTDRVESASIETTARIPGYQLRFNKRGHDGSAKANMFHTGDDSHGIWGAVYAMHMDHKPVLDEIEGVQAGGYHPTEIEFETKDGRSLRGYAYIATPDAVTEAMHPYTWYLDLVLHGARHHGFPDAYCDEIAAYRALQDSDRERDRLNRYGVL